MSRSSVSRLTGQRTTRANRRNTPTRGRRLICLARSHPEQISGYPQKCTRTAARGFAFKALRDPFIYAQFIEKGTVVSSHSTLFWPDTVGTCNLPSVISNHRFHTPIPISFFVSIVTKLRPNNIDATYASRR